MLAEEQAIYPIEGSFSVDGESPEPHNMLVLDQTRAIAALKTRPDLSS